MIRQIRRKHKFIWLVLAILLPLILAASVVFRHDEPVNDKIPNKLTARTPGHGENRK